MFRGIVQDQAIGDISEIRRMLAGADLPLRLYARVVAAGYDTAARQFFALARALGAGLVGSGSRPRCVSEPAAASYVRQTARKYGFAGWRIIPPTVAEPQLCWQAQADPARTPSLSSRRMACTHPATARRGSSSK